MKNIRSWLIAGFIFTAVFGTLSHFFYDWSNENVLIGLISPVNESTWEHMKLLFFPIHSSAPIRNTAAAGTGSRPPGGGSPGRWSPPPGWPGRRTAPCPPGGSCPQSGPAPIQRAERPPR